MKTFSPFSVLKSTMLGSLLDFSLFVYFFGLLVAFHLQAIWNLFGLLGTNVYMLINIIHICLLHIHMRLFSVHFHWRALKFNNEAENTLSVLNMLDHILVCTYIYVYTHIIVACICRKYALQLFVCVFARFWLNCQDYAWVQFHLAKYIWMQMFVVLDHDLNTLTILSFLPVRYTWLFSLIFESFYPFCK